MSFSRRLNRSSTAGQRLNLSLDLEVGVELGRPVEPLRRVFLRPSSRWSLGAQTWTLTAQTQCAQVFSHRAAVMHTEYSGVPPCFTFHTLRGLCFGGIGRSKGLAGRAGQTLREKSRHYPVSARGGSLKRMVLMSLRMVLISSSTRSNLSSMCSFVYQVEPLVEPSHRAALEPPVSSTRLNRWCVFG